MSLFIDPTLVELLVVIAIAGTLVGLLVPDLEAVADTAEAATGKSPDVPSIRACLGDVADSEATARAIEIARRVSIEAGVKYEVAEIVTGAIGSTCDMSYLP